jgi:hypothetical protein
MFGILRDECDRRYGGQAPQRMAAGDEGENVGSGSRDQYSMGNRSTNLCPDFPERMADDHFCLISCPLPIEVSTKKPFPTVNRLDQSDQ